VNVKKPAISQSEKLINYKHLSQQIGRMLSISFQNLRKHRQTERQRGELRNRGIDTNYIFIFLLQMGCYPVAVVILQVNKT